MKNIFVLLFSAALLISCGGDGKKEEKQENSIKLSSKSAEPKDAKEEGVSKVYLTGNDQMRYNKTEIKVNAGDEVVLTFAHVGNMSKETMGHNFVLLKKETDVQEFGQKALEFKANDYIPENSDAIIVHTEMLGGGEKTEITFQAPEKGEYTYICTFPGHLALMKGTFIVE
ncbi:azurin [Psychroflexus sp. YR1-1]|uniref:Azurin n=1 Tax=Psychroflexus aurantiacus TaxID=2709310 RepID=A0A6B3R6V8_9FLAO|nr:azurin [Psychroflexus aurantiacus]NEV94817.1 azurin [Psychroflexus aurantiacus]